jgi:hypothetical protein
MDTLVSARFVGSLFPRGNGTFRVHSVFRSAVNVTAAGEYPVALLVRSLDRHPRGAVLNLPPDTDLRSWGLEVGGEAILSQDRLRFAASSFPVVDLRPAAAFQEAIGPLTSLTGLDRAVAGLQKRQLDSGARLRIGFGGGSEFLRRFAEAADQLPRQFEEGARLVIGLGEGLTPSGDDFLVGWLAAARAVGEPPPSLGGLKNEANSISAAFLDSAERGLFPVSLVALADALGSPERVDDALDALAAVGHSSGLDAATGFLTGLERLSRAVAHG